MHPSLYAGCQETLTRARTKQLRDHIARLKR